MVRKRIPSSPVIDGTITSNAPSGTDAIAVSTNGARVHFGAGASDYASSDGTYVTFNGAVKFRSGNVGFDGGGHSFDSPALLCSNSATLRLRGSPTDGATAVGVATDANNALSTAGAQLVEFRNNATAKCGIPYFGGFYLGGMTTTAINALAGADLREGTMVWDTTAHVPKVYNGTAWKTVTVT